MPAIRPYNSEMSVEAPIGGRQANPTDFGGTGTQELGNAVQAFGKSAGQAQRILLQNQMRREATQVDTATMKANADLTLELQDTVRKWKPGDGDITQTFDGRVRDTFTAIGLNEQGGTRFETAHGQQHFENRKAFYTSQFTVESAKAQAHLDGLAAVAEHAQMVDTEANMLQRAPEFFQSSRENVEAAIRNPEGIYMRPGIGELDRQKLIRQADEALATATVLGAIRKTPALALEKLSSGWMNTYIPHEKYQPLMEHAKTAVHALSVDADRAHKEEEWARIVHARTLESSLFAKLAAHDADPRMNPPLTAQDVLDANTIDANGKPVSLFDADPVKAGSMLSVLHARSREKLEPIQTDPGTMRELFNRIHLPDTDPKKITDETVLNQEYGGVGGKPGKLSFEDFGRLRKELADDRTPEGSKLGQEKANFLKSRMSSITHSNMMLGKLDQEGDTKFGDFGYMVDRKIEEYRKAGKNPHDLFDPKKKSDFLGSPEALDPYRKTMGESVQSISKNLQRKAVPLNTLSPEKAAKPGESYAEWSARQK